jgi:hypothetical protein
MRVVARLWHQHTVRSVSRLHEMMASNIRHDFGAGKDLRMELLLDLMSLLRKFVSNRSHYLYGGKLTFSTRFSMVANFDGNFVVLQ